MKKGFTLAEVLVTLGIIGVVAALTTPALIQNVGNAKIGPKLQKAKATWEVAAEMLLNEENANSIRGITLDATELGDKMSNFMKITHFSNYTPDIKYYDGRGHYAFNNVQTYNSDDGMTYYVTYDGTKVSPHVDYADTPNNQRVGQVILDINGTKEPNTFGKDVFVFILYNDGTLRPLGGKGSDRSYPVTEDNHWSSSSGHSHWAACNETEVGDGTTCAGSIFDNGMKVIYQ